MQLLLFGLTNIAVLAVLAVVSKLFGIDVILAANGQSLTGMLLFAAIFGFAGSIISLLLSKTMAVRAVGAQIIDNPRTQTEAWLVEVVRRQAEAAGIKMPQVAIFDSPDLNAFATGPSRNNSLVAVSTGLMRGMTPDEVEAVLAHEVSHVANGDMVTMALVQGVLNTFVVFFARIVGLAIDAFLRRGDSSGGPGMGYMLGTLVAQVVFGVLAQIIAMWFSRYREFRADAGGARLSSSRKMIAALERLRAQHSPYPLPDQVEAFGISGRMGDGLKRLFMSHPPLEERIRALQVAG